MKNYYNILGVPENAASKEISDAYKKLAQKFHPDRNPDDEFFASWFKEINEAKQVLTKSDERAEYDLNLRNYADAYELLKQQHDEEKFRRFQQRNNALQTKSRRKNWWVAAVFFALIGFVFFYFQVGVNIDGKHAAALSQAPPQILEQDIASDNSKKLSNDLKELIKRNEVEKQQKIKTHFFRNDLPVFYTTINRNEGLKGGGRDLTKNEIAYILQKLDSIKGNNSVHVVQTQKGNIKLDFAIAPILQQHGYMIAGREITNEDQEGVFINQGDNILKLVIGRTGN